MVIYVLEHMEPEVWDWCIIEYTHISEIVGKENLLFTNITTEKDREILGKLGSVEAKSIKELSFENACILDPGAKETLQPKDAEFSYVILGGILGDFPPRKRTSQELTSVLGMPARNLTEKQMSTDTACYVAHKILTGTPIENITFRDSLVVPLDEGEEVELPFQFVEEDGKLVLAKGYIEMIKEQGGI